MKYELKHIVQIFSSYGCFLIEATFLHDSSVHFRLKLDSCILLEQID